ncbi:MAG: hypothetical protein ACE5KV_01760 [Thermoplasmata archaeon]
MNEREIARVISEALGDLHKNETLERALGRFVRRYRGNYEDYLEIISSIRDLAQRKRIDLIEAARRIAASHD